MQTGTRMNPSGFKDMLLGEMHACSRTGNKVGGPRGRKTVALVSVCISIVRIDLSSAAPYIERTGPVIGVPRGGHRQDGVIVHCAANSEPMHGDLSSEPSG